MTCDRILKPELTKEQVAECEKCKHASGKKEWCCRLGFWIKPKSKIIQPGKRIAQPRKKRIAQPKIVKPPTLTQMAGGFSKAMVRWAKKGFKVVSEVEYIRRRTICSECHGGWRCRHCGCILWAFAALTTSECKEGKW